MRLLGIAVLIAQLGALGLAQAEEEAPAPLRFDPFVRPDPERLAQGSVGAARPGQAWSPVLRATLVAGDDSLANLGGTILKLGEETHGYRLVEVRDREAVFEKGGSRLVLTLVPRKSPDR